MILTTLPAFVSGCLPPDTPTPEAHTFTRLQTLPLPEGYTWISHHPLHDQPSYTYGISTLQIKENQHSFAVHKHFPLLAPALVHWKNHCPQALEWQAWTPETDFLEAAFVRLDPELLLQKPDPEIPHLAALLQGLDPWECGLFSFFQPESIGEIIFNNWDK
ncbi:MAG: hypothetical protein ACFCUI_02540 [Bernardetiaceae bacterium]